MGSKRAPFYSTLMLISADSFGLMIVARAMLIISMKFLPIEGAKNGNIKDGDRLDIAIDNHALIGCFQFISGK